ncbi:MAG: bifunctional folylpolyglutamate synthase/dihydrofolate synthase [Christensenellales bacterium]|jgi:dihydrofolate synthase/folylpolyglutamate synthase
MFTNANDAIHWIHGARYKGHKNGLENTRALLQIMGNPERRFRAMHIAGTNGKGSTAAFTERALRESGEKTGLYTSPYLNYYNERMRVDGRPIPDAALVDIVNLLVEKTAALGKDGVYPTTFELGTAIAFEYFARARVDVAVVEVGLGGRFDSTNVITPCVSMIAAIGLDHMKTLGDNVETIAFEKAGIIKSGVPAVVQAQAEHILDVFRAAAREKNSALTIAKMPEILDETPYGTRFLLDGAAFEISLCGRHQLLNASLAIHALRIMGIADAHIQSGIAKAKWPGRLEWMQGALIDGAHNPQGARALRDYIERFYPGEKITLITGMMQDKQMQECAQILAPICARVIATAVDEPRAALPEEMAAIYRALGIDAQPIAGVDRAVDAGMRHAGLRVFAGSLYLAGAVRAQLAARGDVPEED